MTTLTANLETKRCTVITDTGDTLTLTVKTSYQKSRSGWPGAHGGRQASQWRRDCIEYAADRLGLINDNGTISCAICDAMCGIESDQIVDGFALAKIEADRPLQDTNAHPSLEIPYAMGTVIPACPSCNGRNRTDEKRSIAYEIAMRILRIRIAEQREMAGGG